MAQVRIVPSTYQLSNTSYLTISNDTNMYTNVDSTTYATINHNRSGTTSYYIYVRGFDFSQVPSNATINSAVVKVKAYVKSAGSYTPSLYNNTTSLSKTFNGTIGTSATTRSVDITSNWTTYKGYGNNFGIRLQLNRSSRNTASSMYIYGAEILVDYTVAVERTITTSSSGSGSIDPSGTTMVSDGDSFVLTIVPDSDGSTITVTDNGTDVSSQIQQAQSSGNATSTPAAYTTNGSISGTYYQSAVGQGHTTSNTTSNNYCQTSGSTAYISYTFDTSEVPSNATIKSVTCQVKGHCESTSQSTEVADIQLYSGTTAKGTKKSFSSTTDSVVTLDDGTWTRAEVDNLNLRFTIGYYGGNVSGATLTVEYEVAGGATAYTYTIATVGADHTIVVVFGSSAHIFIKENGSWVEYSKVYLKVSGSWVLQDDPSNVFNTSTNYVRSN